MPTKSTADPGLCLNVWRKHTGDIFLPVFHQSIILLSLNFMLPGLHLYLAPKMGIPKLPKLRASNSDTQFPCTPYLNQIKE